MSIATNLERTVGLMEKTWKRNNGDFDKVFPSLLDDVRCYIDSVRGLENLAVISTDTLKSYQIKEAAQHG